MLLHLQSLHQWVWGHQCLQERPRRTERCPRAQTALPANVPAALMSTACPVRKLHCGYELVLITLRLPPLYQETREGVEALSRPARPAWGCASSLQPCKRPEGPVRAGLQKEAGHGCLCDGYKQQVPTTATRCPGRRGCQGVTFAPRAKRKSLGSENNLRLQMQRNAPESAGLRRLKRP